MNKHLHIVSFDVPWPADYGGAIDVFYKIKALHAIGVSITLHCFIYGDRSAQDELLKYCKKVYYYQRITGIQGVSLLRPYIVHSRRESSLLRNLLKDDAPILFEGLHSCFYLHHPALSSRKKFVRAHNVEHEYYRQLALYEKNIFKRYYFLVESYLLKRFEFVLQFADYVLAISVTDQAYFSQYYNGMLIPAFHPNSAVSCQPGIGEYCLYQGNLKINENNLAALFLVEEVFNQLSIKLIIAGANPSEILKQRVAMAQNVQLVENPTQVEMEHLMHNAQIHVLYSADASGLKLKLLNALFQGRFVIANDALLPDEKLKESVVVANSVADYKKWIAFYMQKEFSNADIKQREFLFNSSYSNNEHAAQIARMLFD